MRNMWCYFPMAEIDINIYSLNCNGLGDKTKRIAVLNKLKHKEPGIFLLQETHTTEASNSEWFSIWGTKKIVFSHGTSSQKGVCILISKEYDVNILKEHRHNLGRYIIIDVEINNTIYMIGNLYAPKKMK